MINIKPTTASGLEHSLYSLELVGHIEPNRERGKKISIALDGSAIVSVWPKKLSGAVAELQVILKPEDFVILKRIAYHPTIFEWLVFSGSDRYVCEIDIKSSSKITVSGDPDYEQVTISFTVTQEP